MSHSSWKKCKLGDALNFRRGYDLPKKKMVPGIYPVLGSNGIIGYHNEFTTEAPCVTVGRSGNIGKPQIINKRCWAHNTTLVIDDFKQNDPEFIYYLLKNLNLEFYGGGSAVPTLNRNHVHQLDVFIPQNFQAQKKITNILSSIDKACTTNNKINQNFYIRLLLKVIRFIAKWWHKSKFRSNGASYI